MYVYTRGPVEVQIPNTLGTDRPLHDSPTALPSPSNILPPPSSHCAFIPGRKNSVCVSSSSSLSIPTALQRRVLGPTPESSSISNQSLQFYKCFSFSPGHIYHKVLSSPPWSSSSSSFRPSVLVFYNLCASQSTLLFQFFATF